MSWEIAWAEAGVARRFVQRLSQLSARDRRPALPLLLDSDPYLSAWINVEAALGSVAGCIATPGGAYRNTNANIGALTGERGPRIISLEMRFHF